MQRLTKQILIVGVFALAVESEALAADLDGAATAAATGAGGLRAGSDTLLQLERVLHGGNLGWGFSSPSASHSLAAALQHDQPIVSRRRPDWC